MPLHTRFCVSTIVGLSGLVLALPGAAQAAVNVDPSGNGILVSDNAGPMSVVIGTDGVGHYTFNASGITAGAPCSPLAGTPTKCPADGVTSIFVGGTPGSDGVAVDNFVTPQIIVLGQSGSDTITTGAGPDALSGGLGDDTLNGNNGDDTVTDEQGFSGGGGGGNDTLRGGSGNDELDAGVLGAGVAGATSGGGHDLLDGGSGVDTADYGKRTGPVTITVDSPGVVGNTGNDGEANETDNVINAEHVIGGSAGDTLTASSIPSTLDGGAGDDTLRGADGADTLNPGFGKDTVDGGAGPDAILAQDGEVDTVTCGSGADSVIADSFDIVAADCESVARTAAVPGNTVTVPGPTQTVTTATTTSTSTTVTVPTPVPPKPQAGPTVTLPKALKADRRGRVRVAIGCPTAVKAGCLFGTATLTTAPKKGKGRRIGTTTFSARSGKTVRATITLNASSSRALKKSRKLAVVLTVTAVNGDVQSKTTTAKITVKR